MKGKEKNSFILHLDFENMLQLLSMEQRGQLITAIFEYERQACVTTPLPDVVNMAFCCIKNVLDRDRASYLSLCQKNTENGKKGGRPKKATLASETERFFIDPKKADNDSDSDNDSDNVSDSESGKEFAVDISDEPKTNSAEDPIAPFSCPTAPPPAYIAKRRERARAYAATHKRSVSAVLSDWWQEDRNNPPWNHKSSEAVHLSDQKSYDTDEFIAAALERSQITLRDG